MKSDGADDRDDVGRAQRIKILKLELELVRLTKGL